MSTQLTATIETSVKYVPPYRLYGIQILPNLISARTPPWTPIIELLQTSWLDGEADYLSGIRAVCVSTQCARTSYFRKQTLIVVYMLMKSQKQITYRLTLK